MTKGPASCHPTSSQVGSCRVLLSRARCCHTLSNAAAAPVAAALVAALLPLPPLPLLLPTLAARQHPSCLASIRRFMADIRCSALAGRLLAPVGATVSIGRQTSANLLACRPSSHCLARLALACAAITTSPGASAPPQVSLLLDIRCALLRGPSWSVAWVPASASCLSPLLGLAPTQPVSSASVLCLQESLAFIDPPSDCEF